MKSRCNNPSDTAFKHYGGRGISVCEEWTNSFLSYYNYVSKLNNYDVDRYSIDRINNNGNYEPGNIKYSTQSDQMANQRVRGKSKYRGVSWSKSNNKFRSDITLNGKRIYLGLFSTELKAAQAWNTEAINQGRTLINVM